MDRRDDIRLEQPLAAGDQPLLGHRRHAPPLYGVMAEFESPSDLVAAAHRVYSLGYRRINGYSPYPIEELSEAIGFTKTSLPLIVFIGGIVGGLSGFFMQYWMAAIDYPINVGGKPTNSWPAWIPITFEVTVLFAALSAAIGMLILNGLPRLHHPMFNIPNFERASTDRFFLCIESKDPRFDRAAVRRFLAADRPLAITEVLA